MTNEELAYKIAKKHYRSARQITDSQKECYDSALEMAEWKEQQIIEKACELLKSNLITIVTDDYIYTASVHNISREEFIEQFKKAMEEQL